MVRIDLAYPLIGRYLHSTSRVYISFRAIIERHDRFIILPVVPLTPLGIPSRDLFFSPPHTSCGCASGSGNPIGKSMRAFPAAPLHCQFDSGGRQFPNERPLRRLTAQSVRASWLRLTPRTAGQLEMSGAMLQHHGKAAAHGEGGAQSRIEPIVGSGDGECDRADTLDQQSLAVEQGRRHVDRGLVGLRQQDQGDRCRQSSVSNGVERRLPGNDLSQGCNGSCAVDLLTM
jgi:hypothetical protein